MTERLNWIEMKYFHFKWFSNVKFLLVISTWMSFRYLRLICINTYIVINFILLTQILIEFSFCLLLLYSCCHYYASNLDLKFGCDFGPSQDFNNCFQMFPVPSNLTLVASFMSFLSFKHHGHHSISYSSWESCVLHNFMYVIHKEYVMNSIPWCFVLQNLQKYAQLSWKS